MAQQKVSDLCHVAANAEVSGVERCSVGVCCRCEVAELPKVALPGDWTDEMRCEGLRRAAKMRKQMRKHEMTELLCLTLFCVEIRRNAEGQALLSELRWFSISSD